jgi:hypothetical protein
MGCALLEKTLERGLIDQRRLCSYPFSRDALPLKAMVRRGLESFSDALRGILPYDLVVHTHANEHRPQQQGTMTNRVRHRASYTTRPNMAFPTGTSTIDPMCFTRSPSLIAVSLPKTHNTYILILKIQGYSFHTAGKFHHFSCLNLVQSINTCNPSMITRAR